jgi:NADH-quinone oxidoreductase subunit M
MHGRVGKGVESFEISLRDGVVLVPLVLVILALAVYPQLPLGRSEAAAKSSVKTAQEVANPPQRPGLIGPPTQQGAPQGTLPPNQQAPAP